MEKVVRNFEAGKTYPIYFGGPGGPYKAYVVAIIDEGMGKYYVYRYYGRTKQWWHYLIESDIMFDFLVTQGETKKREAKTKKSEVKNG